MLKKKKKPASCKHRRGFTEAETRGVRLEESGSSLAEC